MTKIPFGDLSSVEDIYVDMHLFSFFHREQVKKFEESKFEHPELKDFCSMCQRILQDSLIQPSVEKLDRLLENCDRNLDQHQETAVVALSLLQKRNVSLFNQKTLWFKLK